MAKKSKALKRKERGEQAIRDYVETPEELALIMYMSQLAMKFLQDNDLYGYLTYAYLVKRDTERRRQKAMKTGKVPPVKFILPQPYNSLTIQEQEQAKKLATPEVLGLLKEGEHHVQEEESTADGIPGNAADDAGPGRENRPAASGDVLHDESGVQDA